MFEGATHATAVCGPYKSTLQFSIVLLQHCWTHNRQFFNISDQNRCSRTGDIVLFIPHILLPCQNMALTLPKTHLNRWASSLNLRWGMGYRGLVSSLLSNCTVQDFFHFQTCSPLPEPMLTWYHLRRFIRLHTAPSGDTKGFIQKLF